MSSTQSTPKDQATSTNPPTDEHSSPTIEKPTSLRNSLFPIGWTPRHGGAVAPNGYGMISKGQLLAIFKDHELGRAYEQLTTTEEKREYLKKYGEDRGQIKIDTRKQEPDGIRCSGEASGRK